MMEVHGHDGTIYPVAYSMFLDDARQWRVQNVIVNGINLGLTFRSQFASSMDQKQNIDQVIDGWSAELDEVNKVTRKG
jgi:phospholipid transport system substrate-binding protein